MKLYGGVWGDERSKRGIRFWLHNLDPGLGGGLHSPSASSLSTSQHWMYITYIDKHLHKPLTEYWGFLCFLVSWFKQC